MPPLDASTLQFSNRMLQPVRYPQQARLQMVNLAPGAYFAGTILGQLSAAAANDVQTVSVTGVPTGGTFSLTLEWPTGNRQTTAPIAYNATAAAVQAALAALPNVGSGNVTCTGGALPGTPVVATFSGKLAATPVPVMTVAANALTGGTTPAPSVAHTTTGTTGVGYAAYASGNGDGSQNPRVILAIDSVSDSSGYISFGTGQGSTGGLWGEKHLAVPAYYAGDFDVKDLIGLDANAVTKLLGRSPIGDITKGVFSF